MEWIANNLQTVIGVFELIGFAIMGILAFTGIWWSKDNDRRTESDTLADGLINRLKQTVEQQTADIKSMGTRIDDQQKEIHVLQGQNEAYLKIITLRDPSVAKVFEEAPKIHEIIRETNTLAKAQSEALTHLTKTLEEFLNRLPPLTATMSA